MSVEVPLSGVDRAAFATAFAARLRRRGLAVGLPAIQDFTRALAFIAPDSVPRLYWVARIALVRNKAELATFDAVFDEVFRDATLSRQLHPRGARPTSEHLDSMLVSVPKASAAASTGDGLPWATLPPAIAPAQDGDEGTAFPERLPGELEALTDVPFEQLSEQELNALAEWLQARMRTWPTRRSRRRAVTSAGGRVGLRPTIAKARSTGWEPVELVRLRPVRKPRRVVMLCDVSQSMQPQVPAYFHLMRALTMVSGGEAFAFATTLTRLTVVLRHKSPAVAMEEASARVTDRFGGTRIAASVSALLRSHHGNVVRGGIVVIGSDGWDSQQPQQLATSMARLRRRAHKVIWINPRVSAPGFEPLVGTMAAALPFCDRLLPAHDFRSLAAVITQISRSVV